MASDQSLTDPLHSQAHSIIDLGDEFFMVGRLHPMIDNDLRIRRMRQEAADEQVGLILFDVVLGEGSHHDPAGELVPVIQSIREKRDDLHFVAVVIGTEDDPQYLQDQIERFKNAGVFICRTVSETVKYLFDLFASESRKSFDSQDGGLLSLPLAAINVGLESFYESLLSQGAQAIHVDWRPPAGGNEKLASLLARMKK
jgi:FdrA protein